LELLKAASGGRLSEVLGSSMIDTDKSFRMYGIPFWGKKNFENLDEVDKSRVLSYVAGINAFIDSSVLFYPLEFKLLNILPTRWEGKDVLSVALLVGFDLSQNYGFEIERLSLLMESKLTPERIEQILGIQEFTKMTVMNEQHVRDMNLTKSPQDELDMQESQKIEFQFARDFQKENNKTFSNERKHAPHTFLFKDLHSSFYSNNWVVSGNKTKSNKTFMCNDPHQGLNAPNLYFFVHLESEDGFNATGASIPGMPAIIMGKNDYVSWGLTNPFVDTVDMFILKQNKNKTHYHRNNEWVTFTNRTELIKVKGGEGVNFISLKLDFFCSEGIHLRTCDIRLDQFSN
jgi:penicillin G amidase